MRLMRKTLAALAFGAVFASLSLAPATAAESRQPETPIARMNVGPISVDWLPAVEYENLVLTVAGPNDFYIYKEFVSGQAPSLSLFQPGGERLPDGIYAYELRAVLRQDQKLHEKSAEAREAEDDFDAQELQEVGKLPEGPLMQSGHLWVQEGSFVAKVPVQLSPPNQRGSASKSPIRNLAAEDIVYNEDLIVKAQACIGSDCLEGDANGPILTLKEIFGGQIKFKAMDCCVPYARSWALQANDPIAGNGDFLIRDSLQGTIPFRIGAAAPDNAFTIWFNGNVGLGTLTPGAKLHLFGTATADVVGSAGPNPASGPALNFGYGGASFGRGAGFLNVRPDASAAAPNPSLRFLTANVERMIIDNEGFIGLGVANPTSPIHHSSGAILTAGGTWQNASSRESKQDIAKLAADEAIATLQDLEPVKFAYKVDPKERHVGFIAEDVPDLVAAPDRKSLSPMDVVAVLTKVVQEQQKTIDELSTTLGELRTKINEIEKTHPEPSPTEPPQ